MTIHLDGTPENILLVPKSESTLNRLIARLPFIPDSYMSRFWTTIGKRVYVPSRRATPDMGSDAWAERHQVILRHEAKHARRARKLSLPLYAVGYLGPSVTVGPIALGVSLFGGLEAFLWTLAVVAALAPLTGGFAVFRALDEWDAYSEAALSRGDRYVDHVAETLWRNYFFTIPPAVTRWWFARLRAREASRQAERRD